MSANKFSIKFEYFRRFFKNRFVLLGLAVRLILAPFFIHQYDFNLFVTAARDFYSSGTLTYFTNWAYPLFYYLILLISYFPAYQISDAFYLFGQTVSVSEKLFIKLPFIISDLFLAYILYRILMENGKEKYALFIALFYLLNPLSIFTSSVYGTFDSISVLFSILGFYHFLHRKYGLSGLELGIGFGIKFQSAILIPIFLLLLWKEAKRRIPKFILCFGGPAALSLILPAIIYYNPITHYWSFNFSTSNLASSYARAPVVLVDPNMTYRTLLLRLGYSGLSSYSTLIELATFGGLFLLFIFLVWRKGLFERYSQSRLEYVTACAIAVYMIFFLSYGRINIYYALWALPFLLIFFSFKDLNRFMLLTFNLIPLAQNFQRDSIFYYLNGNYTYSTSYFSYLSYPIVQAYGVGYANEVAIGFLFSLSCALIFAYLFRDAINIYQPLKRVNQFFNQLSERRKTVLLSLTLIFAFLMIIKSLNLNGLYWSGYPVTLYTPIEGIPSQLAGFLLVLSLLFGILPLSIFLSSYLHTSTLEPDKRVWKYLKLTTLLISISLLIVLGCVILVATLPYIASGAGFFLGGLPLFETLRVLCEQGGIITFALILISSAIALDLLSKPWNSAITPSNLIKTKG